MSSKDILWLIPDPCKKITLRGACSDQARTDYGISVVRPARNSADSRDGLVKATSLWRIEKAVNGLTGSNQLNPAQQIRKSGISACKVFRWYGNRSHLQRCLARTPELTIYPFKLDPVKNLTFHNFHWPTIARTRAYRSTTTCRTRFPCNKLISSRITWLPWAS